MPFDCNQCFWWSVRSNLSLLWCDASFVQLFVSLCDQGSPWYKLTATKQDTAGISTDVDTESESLLAWRLTERFVNAAFGLPHPRAGAEGEANVKDMLKRTKENSEITADARKESALLTESLLINQTSSLAWMLSQHKVLALSVSDTVVSSIRCITSKCKVEIPPDPQSYWHSIKRTVNRTSKTGLDRSKRCCESDEHLMCSVCLIQDESQSFRPSFREHAQWRKWQSVKNPDRPQITGVPVNLFSLNSNLEF